jgi:hypothetical protein
VLADAIGANDFTAVSTPVTRLSVFDQIGTGSSGNFLVDGIDRWDVAAVQVISNGLENGV